MKAAASKIVHKQARTVSVKRSCNASSARRGMLVRCQAAPVKFSKYQGLGNDFILIDNRHQNSPVLTPEQAAKLCDRHFGVGGDGVIFALPPENGTDLTMRIYNSDGSEPEMCGNGIRCLARFVADVDGVSTIKYQIHTLAGLIQPTILEDGRVRVDMGEPILKASEVPTTLAPTQGEAVVQQKLAVAGKEWLITTVSMGNPHALIYSYADGSPIDVSFCCCYCIKSRIVGYTCFHVCGHSKMI